MTPLRLVTGAALFLLGSQLLSAVRAEGPTKQLLDLDGDIQKRLTPQFGANDQVSAAVSKDPAVPGLVITIRPASRTTPA